MSLLADPVSIVTGKSVADESDDEERRKEERRAERRARKDERRRQKEEERRLLREEEEAKRARGGKKSKKKKQVVSEEEESSSSSSSEEEEEEVKESKKVEAEEESESEADEEEEKKAEAEAETTESVVVESEEEEEGARYTFSAMPSTEARGEEAAIHSSVPGHLVWGSGDLTAVARAVELSSEKKLGWYDIQGETGVGVLQLPAGQPWFDRRRVCTCNLEFVGNNHTQKEAAISYATLRSKLDLPPTVTHLAIVKAQLGERSFWTDAKGVVGIEGDLVNEGNSLTKVSLVVGVPTQPQPSTGFQPRAASAHRVDVMARSGLESQLPMSRRPLNGTENKSGQSEEGRAPASSFFITNARHGASNQDPKLLSIASPKLTDSNSLAHLWVGVKDSDWTYKGRDDVEIVEDKAYVRIADRNHPHRFSSVFAVVLATHWFIKHHKTVQDLVDEGKLIGTDASAAEARKFCVSLVELTRLVSRLQECYAKKHHSVVDTTSSNKEGLVLRYQYVGTDISRTYSPEMALRVSIQLHFFPGGAAPTATA